MGNMSLINLDFKHFLEEMDPTMDKKVEKSKSGDDQPIDFLAALGDEMGMDWDTIQKVFQGEPWVSTHFALGPSNIAYKAMPWEVVPGTMTPKGCYIRLKNLPGQRSYLPGRRLNKSSYVDDKQYYVTRKQLIHLFHQDHSPPAGGGAMGGVTPPMMI